MSTPVSPSKPKRTIPKNTDLRRVHSAGHSMDSETHRQNLRDARVAWGGLVAGAALFFAGFSDPVERIDEHLRSEQKPPVTVSLDAAIACAFLTSPSPESSTEGPSEARRQKAARDLEQCLRDAEAVMQKNLADAQQPEPGPQAGKGVKPQSASSNASGAVKQGEAKPGARGGEKHDSSTSVNDLRSRGLLQAWKQDLAAEIAGYWRIDRLTATQIVSSVMHAAETHRVDPFLVLGVIAVESSFRNEARSRENAEGLMQVIRRWHPQETAAIPKDRPMSVTQSIAIGTQVLKKYIERNNGNVVAALQGYNGASGDDTLKYSRKVLAQRSRFVQTYASFEASQKNRLAMNDSREHRRLSARPRL